MILPDASQYSQTTENQRIDRRGVLTTLGLASLGMWAASGTANAATPAKSMPKISVPTNAGNSIPGAMMRFNAMPDVPEEWAVRNGSLAAEYLRYLKSLGLQRVSPSQVVETHAKEKGGVWNTIPPKQWWNRMGYVLKVVDRVASEMNVNQVEIISAYRCPAYNARCPGAKCGSWHQANVAADVKFPVRASVVTATARNLRNLGLFRGGVGGYWNFTHIDARGKNIDWNA